MTEQELQKDGEPYYKDTEELACPDCGVIQSVKVKAQQYQDQPTQYFVDKECPVCEFSGVWF